MDVPDKRGSVDRFINPTIKIYFYRCVHERKTKTPHRRDNLMIETTVFGKSSPTSPSVKDKWLAVIK